MQFFYDNIYKNNVAIAITRVVIIIIVTIVRLVIIPIYL